ncbi:Alpha/Beta hydrolase protein [Immersiella caudata]|uniref:Alpha/Beta hydrolase protein n=1 Tax=Immersiella caudata TaxID=314043 RepID=A0AA39XH54_9PEZI|nr:Alpha/Beta hydrolase protein [Immersiella caudata]
MAALSLGLTTQASVVHRQTASGSGPYPASYSTDSGLAGQTIYMPTTVPAGVKLPVIVWGVGGCSDSGTNTAEFHNELASHGFLVIVNNSPTARTQTVATSLITAADWAAKVAGTGKYANVDKSRVAVGGWSCGGLQAYTVSSDPRWATIGIFSSGQLDASQSVPVVGKITKPIFYFLGGNGDPAQTPGTRDYGNLPKTTPAWIGTNNKGHGHSGPTGTFTTPSIKTATVRWAQWLLKGNATAATYFTNNAEATQAGWTGISSQNLDKINVTAI